LKSFPQGYTLPAMKYGLEFYPPESDQRSRLPAYALITLVVLSFTVIGAMVFKKIHRQAHPAIPTTLITPMSSFALTTLTPSP